MNYDDEEVLVLSEEQKDALGEVANIATGKAILALSKMMDPKTHFNLSLKEMRIEDLFEIKGFNMNSDEEKYIGVRVIIKHDIPGVVYMIFPASDFLMILNEIKFLNETPKYIDNLSNLTPEDSQKIQEIGNILISHYCSAIADFLSVKIYHDVPQVAFGEYNALIDVELAKLAHETDQAIFIQTNMIIEEKKVIGEFMFIPYAGYLKKFINLLDEDKIIEKMDKK